MFIGVDSLWVSILFDDIKIKSTCRLKWFRLLVMNEICRQKCCDDNCMAG